MEVNFCEYLINIGFINKESFSNLILQYHKFISDASDANINFLDNMNHILTNFINNLSQEEKNYMSLNLIKYYLQFITNKKLCRLRSLYMLYKGKVSLIKIKYLYRWKSLNFTKENNNNNLDTNLINKKHVNKKVKSRKKRNEENCLEKFKFNFLSMKINNNNKYVDKFQVIFNNNYSKKKHRLSSKNESSIKKLDSTTKDTKENTIKNKKNMSELQTSLALKEQKEFQECTFSPKINHNHTARVKSPKLEDNDMSAIGDKHKYIYNQNRNNSERNSKKKFFEIFEKLHNDNVIYKNKIKLSKEKYEEKLKEINTFRPKIYNNSFTKNFAKKNNKSFSERQKDFLEKKIEISEKIKKIAEEKFSKLYTFVPEINISNSNILKEYYTNTNNIDKKNKYSSPFLRLYEESKNRNMRQNKREKEYDDKIIDMANISCKKENKVDYQKINELYLYQKKKEIMEKTKKKVEEEEGSTFKPDIYINECGKNINSDFFERNEKFLIDKKNFIELSIKEQNKVFTKNKNKYSKEEKKEIVNNIMKRLTNEKNNI